MNPLSITKATWDFDRARALPMRCLEARSYWKVIWLG